MNVNHGGNVYSDYPEDFADFWRFTDISPGRYYFEMPAVLMGPLNAIPEPGARFRNALMGIGAGRRIWPDV